MNLKVAKAAVTPVRQRTQYSCMAASLSMCLKALGSDMDEDTVNKVMGARPMQGASWEQALAAAQHFGMRATLISPCTLSQLREWTDAGVPVMIAWNPEGRPWSHASVVFDVTDTEVFVADPNIPDPAETVRVVTHTDFFGKWGEKWENYIVRRPAMAIEREVTPEGKQVKLGSTVQPLQTRPDYGQVEDDGKGSKMPRAAGAVLDQRDTLTIDANMAREIRHKFKDSLLDRTPIGGFTLILDNPKSRSDRDATVDVYFRPNPDEPGGYTARLVGSAFGDVKEIFLQELKWVGVRVDRVAGYKGNPDGKDIYPNEVNHGAKGEPLAGGTDVMRQLQNRLLQEQGQPPRPESPKVGARLQANTFATTGAVRRIVQRWISR